MSVRNRLNPRSALYFIGTGLALGWAIDLSGPEAGA